MASENRSRYDELDDADIAQLIKKKASRKSWAVPLLVGGVIVVSGACLLGIAIVGLVHSTGTQPDEFIGTWKGRWTIGAETFDSTYTFHKDGTLIEETLRVPGFPPEFSQGRWRFRNGQIEIDWNNQVFERAIVTHQDDRTMNYRVISHTDQRQVGVVVTFRRQ